jgi:hypothetical protein
VATPLPRG